MIPDNRPVIGRDLDDIRQTRGLSTADACYLFGMSITRWTAIVRGEGAEVPVKDPTLAMLIRLLDWYPDASITPKFPTAPEMFDLINTIEPTDKKRFAILMGSEASAGYRWLSLGVRQNAITHRLFYYQRLLLLGRNPNDQKAFLAWWAGTAEKEAAARGVPDVWRQGVWRPKPPKAGKAPAARAVKAPKLALPKPPRKSLRNPSSRAK